MNSKPKVPVEVSSRWQGIVDTAARLLEVPACLIMKRNPPRHDVFLTSESDDNPYTTETSFTLNTGLYCDAVMKEKSVLTVMDAIVDPEWNANPDLEHGMSFYIGFPLQWPDGSMFGTICVLDRKPNQKASDFASLLEEFRYVIENDLKLLVEIHERQKVEQELCEIRDELETRVKRRTDKLAETNNELDDANTALKVLVQNVEKSKSELEAQIISNISKLILPYVDKIRPHISDEKAKAYLSILETNLFEVTGSVASKLTDKLTLLTPTETEIVKLIQQGKSTKEIAGILTTATSTVDFHRNNIRKKLGIQNGGVNLNTYLHSLN